MRLEKMRFIAIAFLILLVVPLAQALSLGVSPSDFSFQNMTKGGYAAASGVLSTLETGDLSVSYDVLGERSGWVDVDIGDGLLNRESPLEFNVTVTPPVDAANGDYSAKIRFFLATSFIGENIESRVFTGLTADISFNVVGEEKVNCIIGGVSIIDTEEGYPLELYLTVKNDGNVRVAPKIDIEILDQNMNRVLYEDSFYADETLPTTEKRIFEELSPDDLLKGQYWIQVSSEECVSSDLKTFSIVGLGEVSDQGEFLRLETPEVSGSQGLVPVQAYFKNTGTRVVGAKLRATVSLDGVIVDIIESEELEVRPNEVVNLEAYFEPDVEGDYVVSGQIIYNNKLSYEKATNLVVAELEGRHEGFEMITGDVIGGTKGQGNWFIFFVLLIVIGGLIGLIMVRKRRV